MSKLEHLATIAESLRLLSTVATDDHAAGDDHASASEERHVVADDIKAASYFMALCMAVLLFGYLLFIMRKFVDLAMDIHTKRFSIKKISP
jgi:uncharacterized protein YhbP (UPF0306 family)